MPDTWREQIDIARAIKGILDSYPSNSILREILQNSDDAGATKQIFILDHRQHGTNNMIESALERTQGPALLAVNDSVFNDADWTAVRTMNASNKTKDETKTGKYGLGIRACYHVTDNMHILSGDKLAITDPHDEFQRYTGGLHISLEAEKDLYHDQIAAFSAALPYIPSYSEGTVVRLPLRTPAEASRSRIKPLPVTLSDIQALYQSFIRNELSVALLFLKHIMSIELREINDEDGDTLIAQVSVSNSEVASFRSFIPGADKYSNTYRLDVLSTVGGTNPILESWRITHLVLSKESVEKIMEGRLGYDVGDRLLEDKLSSHIALAFPLLGQHMQGRLFTLLPLPILTGLPFDVHGIFALTPDRQSLRNPEELGIGLESRERLLVTWNRMIFEDFLSEAWLYLVHTLIRDDTILDIWSAWPPQNVPIPFASSLLARFADTVLTRGDDIFPAQIQGETVPIGSGLPALIAEASIDRKLLHAVSMTGIPIIIPPPYIYHAFKCAGLKEPECSFRFFDAQSVHEFLQLHISELKALQDEDKDCILEYLICASPAHVIGLPLIPTVDRDRIALSRPTQRSKRYTLATVAEAEIFCSCDKAMVNLSVLSDNARAKLNQCSNGNVLNVVHLGPDILKGYLMKILGMHSDNEQLSLTKSLTGLSWFCAFWKWIDGLHNSKDFFAVASSFHLLPMLNDTIRHVTRKAFLIPDGRNGLYEMLRSAGVPFLHPLVSSTNTLSAYGKIISVDNFLELISVIHPDIQDSGDRLTLQKHLVECLQFQKNGPVLNFSQRASFRVLPVFPTRIPRVPAPVTELNTATGRLQYINVDPKFPLPILEDVTFIDMSESSRVLGLALEPDSLARALNEVELINITLPNLSKQPSAFQDLLMQQILPRLLSFTEENLNTIRHQKFVPAVGSAMRVSPADIISPTCSLAGIFRGEPGRFPERPYTDYKTLAIMVTAELFCTKLSFTMLNERIEHLSSSADPARFGKAKVLFRILLEQWHPSFAPLLQTDKAWIPTVSSGLLAARQQCRDVTPEEHHFLFDFVLSCVSSVSGDVRTALGWTTSLSFDILHRQFQATLDKPFLEDRSERLLCLIKYIASKYSKGDFTLVDLGPLQDFVRDRNWIPLSDLQLAHSERTLLDFDLKIGTMFCPIPNGLRDKHCIKFLQAMGSSERPTIDALLRALDEVKSLRDMVALLSELSSHEGELTDNQRNNIRVPGQDLTLEHLSEVYFDDMGNRSDYITLKDDLVPVHSAISKMVAHGLGIPFLSSLHLDDDEDLDIDDEDMSESLTTRIKNVLNEYNVEYSFNEFLANAADAGAGQFRVVLDAKPSGAASILCPEMEIFQRGPAMILSNDAIFEMDDFRGIRSVGEGGKQNISGTIGKFGLGALSFYHFSEVVFIISGCYIMILDPSGSYLPKRRGQIRRSLWRKLKDFRRRYADHLAPIDGIFGFSSSQDSYTGTLIRLPLRFNRSSSSRLSNVAVSLADCRTLIMDPYYRLSQTALFFTPLRAVSALERLGSGKIVKLWEIDRAITQIAESDDDGAEASIFNINRTDDESKLRQQWLIIKDLVPLVDVPERFLSVVQKLKATDGIKISLAFCLDHRRTAGAQYHLFCGLQLPETLTLPVHVDAIFAVASDRRGIRFDPPDSNGQRVLQSAYNAWLLSHVIPPLYLRGLQSLFQIIPSHRKLTDWWPRKAQGPISEEVTNALYNSLPTTNLAVFPTVTGVLVAPKNAMISSGEPEPVRKLLTRLRIPNFVVLGSITSLLPKSQLPMLGVDSLTQVLKQALVEEGLQELFQAELLKRINHREEFDGSLLGMEVISMFDATIRFLLDGTSTSGHTVLLLVTKDLKLRRFNDSPTFYFAGDLPDTLFPHSEFLSNGFSGETRMHLSRSPLYRVQELNGPVVLNFISRHVGDPREVNSRPSEASLRWVESFWHHFQLKHLPRDLKFEHLSGYPLFPTFDAGLVSLAYCRSGRVLPDPKISELRNVMHDLNIPVLRKHKMLPLDDPRLQFSFRNFLECLLRQESNPFERDIIANDRAAWLAKWVVEKMRFGLHELDATHLNLLAQFPLWEATRDGVIQRLSANELRQLPFDIELSKVKRFLDPNQSIAQHASELQNLWSIQRKQRRFTTSEAYAEFSRMLHLNDAISEDDLPDYKYLLEKLIRGNVNDVKVPDGRLLLRSPEELFNNTVELFSAAFHCTQDIMFVHPDFRNLQRSLNVKTTPVTFEIFRQCAQAIHDEHLPDRDDRIFDRAAIVYRHYNNVLPSRIMANEGLWRQLDDLSFIPCSTAEDISYNLTPSLARHHPDAIASPNDLLRREFQHLAWTQRSLFVTEPTQNHIAVHPNIGAPTAEEVVSHLVILATQVASVHSHNRMLITDLKRIYNWLNQERWGAATALKRRLHEPIFLNVVDINDYFEPWQWRSAHQLVLNLSYDSQRCFKVEPFLLEFRELLVSAGVRKRVEVTHKDETELGDPKFERLRAAGKLLDIELRPEFLGEDENVEPTRLRAHRAFLAAHVTHIEEALTGGWNESTNGELSFPGSYFSARTFLDLLYTGDVKDERPDEDGDAMTLLQELLAMLSIADIWDLPTLKNKLGWLITVKYSFIQPETLETIQSEAEKYSATELVRACEEFAKKNATILEDFTDA